MREIKFGPHSLAKEFIDLQEFKQKAIDRIESRIKAIQARREDARNEGEANGMPAAIIEAVAKVLSKAERLESCQAGLVKARQLLGKISTVDELSVALAIDRNTLPLPAQILGLLRKISSWLPALNQASIYMFKRDSFWARFFGGQDRGAIAQLISLRDRTGETRHFIFLYEGKELEEFDRLILTLTGIKKAASADRLASSLIHEALHMGQKIRGCSGTSRGLVRIIMEGYTRILERRMFRSIFGREQSSAVAAYPHETQLVEMLIETAGEEAVCDSLYNQGDFDSLAKILGEKLYLLQDMVAILSDKEFWPPLASQALKGAFDNREKFRALLIELESSIREAAFSSDWKRKEKYLRSQIYVGEEGKSSLFKYFIDSDIPVSKIREKIESLVEEYRSN